MRNSILASVRVLGVAVVVAGDRSSARSQVGGQRQESIHRAAKTPWGDPDLQGVWNDATSTPLQRPGNVGEKSVLTDEEAAEFQASLAHDLTRDRRDGGSAADVNRAYSDHWMDARRLKITADHRTSLIVDPRGRTDSAAPCRCRPSARRCASRASRRATRDSTPACPDDYTDMSLAGALHHPHRLAAVSADDLQQRLPDLPESRAYVDDRARDDSQRADHLHADGRPHLEQEPASSGSGDSRGRWDGTTLVVETTNFRADDGVMFQSANPATFKITERFTRVASDVDQLRVHRRGSARRGRSRGRR